MKPGGFQRFKPAVKKHVLLWLAGIIWVGVGVMLLSFACHWLSMNHGGNNLVLISIGTLAALLIHHFGFLKIVDKNLGRILPMEGRRCAFSFMSWKSYLLVVVMVAMGIGLRHSPIPKPYLSMVYIGIGLALILSSIRYLRVALSLPDQ